MVLQQKRVRYWGQVRQGQAKQAGGQGAHCGGIVIRRLWDCMAMRQSLERELYSRVMNGLVLN